MASQNTSKVGASAGVLEMVDGLDWQSLPLSVRHAARRHFVDTCGVIIAGMSGDVARAIGRCMDTQSGGYAVPGSNLRLSRENLALLAGTAAHGIELDDGHRGGSVHPGVAVVPALLAASSGVSGQAILTALVVGYEVICAFASAGNPAMRRRGFHPTSVAGPLGAAMSVGHATGLDRAALSNALGIAASTSGGLFAFLSGGGDVKRLHGGLAAQGGLMAALWAAQGIDAPADILERESGMAQAFFGTSDLALSLPPQVPFEILNCYVKPYACCRHLQPAMEAVMDLRATHNLDAADVDGIEVEVYATAAKHAETGWGDMASAQLSFPYCLALAARLGRADLSDFDAPTRNAEWVAPLAAKVRIRATDEMTARYPKERPARVTLHTTKGPLIAEATEARGGPELPLDDAALALKFKGLVAPVLGSSRAQTLFATLWSIGECPDVGSVLKEMAL